MKPRCHNCKYASEAFKVYNLTYHHCLHPKHKESQESGEAHPWDTLREWYLSCESHEYKDITTKPNQP